MGSRQSTWRAGFAVFPMLLFPLASTAGAQSVPRVRVDCRAGQSVQAALDASSRAAPIEVTVAGVCDENVVIRRDDVTIQGERPSDGFAPSSGTAIELVGARRVQVLSLSIRSRDGLWDVGVRAEPGSELLLAGADVSGGRYGIVLHGSTSRIFSTVVRETHSNAVQVTGGSATFSPLTVEEVGATGLTASRGAEVFLNESTFRAVTSSALSVATGATLEATHVTVEEADVGISVNANATAVLNEVRIADTRQSGIIVRNGSHVSSYGLLVEHSGADGVYVVGGSTLTFDGEILNSTYNGIGLHDTSLVIPYGTPSILNSGVLGIFCARAPAVAQVAPTGFDPAFVSGNGAGATNCPSLGLSGRIP